jgi:hypothetical protein
MSTAAFEKQECQRRFLPAATTLTRLSPLPTIPQSAIEETLARISLMGGVEAYVITDGRGAFTNLSFSFDNNELSFSHTAALSFIPAPRAQAPSSGRARGSARTRRPSTRRRC